MDENETVPCELCATPTPMIGTRRCDRCWELEHRIRHNLELARKILAALDPPATCSLCGGELLPGGVGPLAGACPDCDLKGALAIDVPAAPAKPAFRRAPSQTPLSSGHWVREDGTWLAKRVTQHRSAARAKAKARQWVYNSRSRLSWWVDVDGTVRSFFCQLGHTVECEGMPEVCRGKK